MYMRINICVHFKSKKHVYIYTCNIYIFIYIQGFPLIYVNKAFEKITGYPRCEIIGKKTYTGFSQVGQDDVLNILQDDESEAVKKLTKVYMYKFLYIHTYMHIFLYMY
jgi:PAS domain S-box-containing protein